MTSIPIEISARHVHLTSDDWQQLFGRIELTPAHPISQPEQFVASQRVTLSGPKGQLENVAVVGPLRPYTQVELSLTDARRLGLKPPLSDSGRLEQAAEITCIGPVGTVTRAAAIIQQRHIHSAPADAIQHGLTDRQIVSVTVRGKRGGRFDQVLVRVHPSYSWSLHIDTDEANAFGLEPGTEGEIRATPEQ